MERDGQVAYQVLPVLLLCQCHVLNYTYYQNGNLILEITVASVSNPDLKLYSLIIGLYRIITIILYTFTHFEENYLKNILLINYNELNNIYSNIQ